MQFAFFGFRNLNAKEASSKPPDQRTNDDEKLLFYFYGFVARMLQLLPRIKAFFLDFLEAELLLKLLFQLTYQEGKKQKKN